MRRSLLFSSVIAVLGLVVMGVSTCTTTGPAAKSFAAGSLVIPMDNCYQKRDSSSAPGGETVGCKSANDGVFRAYGLVYFLLKNGVTVYWGIDGATPKLEVIGADVKVPAPPPGTVVAQRMNWGDGTFTDLGTGASGITYIGGPFIIDAADADRAVKMMMSVSDSVLANADFARLKLKTEAVIDVHKVQVGFDAKQVRPLTTTPPKLAILNINPAPIHKTSVDVMYRYAVAAGLSWPCTGNGDCAGGIGPSCSLQGIYDYLANRGSSFVSPTITTPPTANPQAVFNNGPGLAYDVLCDGDFIPPANGGYADTYLAKGPPSSGGYKLLWAPHWDTAGVDPLANPATVATTRLAAQLKTISDYVNAGNNIFAECLAIGALEGGGGQKGLLATRFQTTAGMNDTTSSVNSTLALDPIASPKEPNVQVGDFVLLGKDVDGAITTFHPDNAPTAPVSAYKAGVQRLIFGTAGNKPGSTCNPACTGSKVCWNNTCVEATPWDVATTFVVPSQDGVGRGSVAYLGGHDYSPSAEPTAKTPGGHADAGQTAGTRIVLNTLFNLGFACANPNTTCTTGLLGACAQGVLKCAGGGGLQCVAPPAAGAPLCDGSDADANCNGIPDKYEAACQQPACVEGAQRACYDGLPASTADVGVCKTGQQTCTGGLWGPCGGLQKLPQHEVCNGLDDNCDGTVDEGSLCGPNATCNAGICLPKACNSETARCPNGFTCNSVVDGTCQPVACPTSPCPAGKLCQAGACVDPCASIICGAGSSCSGGQCVAGGCAISPCADPTNVCVAGDCVADPCAGNTCPTGTFCRLGDCVRSCAYVSCAPGQTCDADGFCQSDCSPACSAGQACVAGACVADACVGVQCASGQACQAGACVDKACSHVVCPQVSSCVAGQCVGGVTSSVETPITPVVPKPAGGGCGTGGAGDLASLALAAGALWARRRRLAPLLAGARSAAVLAVGCALALGLTGCSKAGGQQPVGCTAGQTACGADCVDLGASLLHCGACGHGCASTFSCTAGACVFATGNPLVQSVTPSAFGLGASPALRLGGIGFLDGAKVRVTLVGRTQELALAVESSSSATVAAGAIDMTGAGVGAGELRVLNPGRLLSNAMSVSVIEALAVRAVTPAFLQQDGTADVDMKLLGLGFVQGAAVSLTVNGTVKALPTTFTGPGEVHATLPAPSTLPIGRHALLVTNPGGATSTPATFSVNEGAPAVASVDVGPKTPCVAASPTFSGSVTGSFVYPSSVVRVSGGSIVDSPLDTTCLNGTDALGQCAGGQLRVVADLSPVTPGPYDITVWNPGSPVPLKSGPKQIQVQVACP